MVTALILAIPILTLLLRSIMPSLISIIMALCSVSLCGLAPI